MSTHSAISRRRMLQISAAACGSALLTGPAGASLKVTVWRGVALGADATIRLFGADEASARATLEAVTAEIRRLEDVFSLYRRDSALTRLNRTGVLAAPPVELVALMSTAHGVSVATGGAFDATMQPLWALYARHFARHPGAAFGPSQADIDRALVRVDYRAVSLQPERIAFRRPGMAASLNGIAQGYITDRAADILRRAGFCHVVIDLGETRALGRHPTGRPWRVGIRAPGRSGAILRELQVVDRAVATSAPGGTPFEASGRYHHLIDPRTGRCAGSYRSLTVTAPNATLADALSTAFCVMPWPRVETVAARYPGVAVDALRSSGAWARIVA